MRRIHISAWLLVALSTLLQILIFPLPGFYILSWVAFAPLLVAFLRARPAAISGLESDDSVKLQAATPWQAFLMSYFSGIVWYWVTCHWVYESMHDYGGLSVPAATLVLTLYCLAMALCHGAFGLVVGLLAGPGRDHRRALVVAPFLWAAIELGRKWTTGVPWDLLGTAQVDNVPLCRIATWTGVYGISCEIMLVNVAVAAAFLVPRQKRFALLVAALASAAVLQSGRLIEPPASVTDHAALLVQQNIPIAVRWTRPYFDQTLSELTALSVKPAADAVDPPAKGPNSPKLDLVVWPESPAPFFSNDPIFRNTVSKIAIANQTWMVVGALGTSGQPQAAGQEPEVFNSAALISPAGEWTARYDKIHLVPFGEYLPFPKLLGFAAGLTKAVGEFGRGWSRQPLVAGDERLGVFICYESVFPDEVRQFAGNGAQVFVNISNDGWYGDSGAWSQHLNQTRMRAIENERWILSVANTGVTASIDPYGRIVVRAPRKERTTLLAPYALTSVTTFYSRHGDWFAILCAIISIAALFERFACASRKKTETPS
ncbi:MAG TPA: apolipoprotein N-acyltransferase [Candidatus Sulfotelmatobacter sp.]|nr:apolipoprotein N-acyltransferase [Candidatus Sulfotelmatobacter sp.]